MDKRRKSSAATWATLAVCLLAVGVGSWQLLRRAPADRGGDPPQTGAVSAPQTIPVPDPDPVPDPIPEAVPDPDPQRPAVSASGTAQVLKEDAPPPVPDPDPAPAVTAPVEIQVFPEEPRMAPVPPLEGETVAAFSMDALQYDATMADWRTHDGIDIAADPGTEVLSAWSGTVRSIEDDPLMGLTVTIAHPGGYETTYASLLEVPVLEVGDHVPAGDLVGTVGGTAIAEAAQGPHLHFSVRKDGEPVDPEEFLLLEDLESAEPMADE